MTPPKSQIIYFPYLGFRDQPLKFNKLYLWNFDKKKDIFIPDQAIRDYVEKLLKANVSYDRPLEDMAVFSELLTDFRYQKEYVDLVGELRRVLFLCGISKSNLSMGEQSGHFMVTADNFTHIFQNFVLGSPWTSISSGRIVQINAGGHEVGKVKYEKPPYVLSAKYNMDKELFAAFKTLKRKKNRIYKQILASIDSFMSGYLNISDISYESMILQQVRAFEILFDLPEGEQRKVFKDKIDTYCSSHNKDKERTYRFLSERSKGSKKFERGPMAFIWADKFYTLRNHIMHGERIKTDEFSFHCQRHWDLALLFYVLSVKKVINETLDKDLFYDEIKWRKGMFQYDRCDLYRSILKSLKGFKKAVDPQKVKQNKTRRFMKLIAKHRDKNKLLRTKLFHISF